MKKIDQLAIALLDSNWTKEELTRIITRVTRKNSKAHALPLALKARFPYPPSRQMLVKFLRRSTLGREFPARLLRRLELANRYKPVSMRTSLAFPNGWDIPEIASVTALAELFGLPIALTQWLSEERHSHYRIKIIRKRRSGARLLEAPKVRLKAVQRKIATQILNAVPAHTASHGFTRGRSAISYVQPHVGHAIVLRMDLADFFPSITATRVFGLFRSLGYPYAITQLLTNLCTASATLSSLETALENEQRSLLNGYLDLDRAARDRLRSLYCRRHLPQGAPSSPQLANLIAYRLDFRLAGLAASAGVNYTRYADDLLFSGEPDFGRTVKAFSQQVAIIALDEGFEVNFRKTRLMRQATRQFAAGIVINRRVNIERDTYDQLRAVLHNCVKFGPVDQNRDEHSDFRSHLLGRINWVKQLNPNRGEKLMQTFNKIRW